MHTLARWFASAAMLASGILINTVATAQSFVPLLDEYEGIAENDGRYLILPAFENTDPATKRRAYFIFPKFLQYAGDSVYSSINLGVNHIGYSLLPDGSADFSPRLALVATVIAEADSKTETAIKEALIKRDLAEGFLEPAFPTPVYETYDISVVTAGLSSHDEDQTVTFQGGYPGQSFLVKAKLFTDANRAFVLETPSKAGKDANLWGVAIRGKIKGYGNRLDCSISLNIKKTYDYFAARASAQAYWGAVGADVSTEVRKMADEQVIDFGACRGDQEKIDKLVMPTWQIILDLRNDDGEKMFYQMVKEVTTGTNHPGKSESGWGFQASARWASVSSTKSVTFNFNVATPIFWTMPMAMSFVSSCSALKANFINGSDPKKPCVEAGDASRIRAAQKKCVEEYATAISKLSVPEEFKKILYKELFRDGCGFNFTSPEMMISTAEYSRLRGEFEATRRRVQREVRALTAN